MLSLDSNAPPNMLARRSAMHSRTEKEAKFVPPAD
jgi:hypothetical protein